MMRLSKETSEMTLSRDMIDRIVMLAKQYGATRLILFGSALEPGASFRDLDLACDGIQGWKLYEFAARLEDELGTPADIVPLSPANRFTRKLADKGRILL
jgi:predicted nucleotidyltransferase